MVKNYVLDTSALLTYLQSEEGSKIIEEILMTAKRSNHVYISFITLMELYYIIWQEEGEHKAKEILVLLKSLPIQIVESNHRITLIAGRIKANHKLSVADAFIVATAIEKEAMLVHKDPELENVSRYAEILTLPYKSKN